MNQWRVCLLTGHCPLTTEPVRCIAIVHCRHLRRQVLHVPADRTSHPEQAPHSRMPRFNCLDGYVGHGCVARGSLSMSTTYTVEHNNATSLPTPGKEMSLPYFPLVNADTLPVRQMGRHRSLQPGH
jgi:hypothetical protein